MGVNFEHNVVETNTIEELWAHAAWLTATSGIFYRVQEGSYKGQLRLQLPYFMGRIITPGKRPLAPTGKPSLPPPTTEEAIEKYFLNFLMGDVTSGFDYTYGHYVLKQIDKVIEKLNMAAGGTNQATITIGDDDSINLDSPPCLKVISFKVNPSPSGYWLDMAVYFRSWDVIAGLPENLGGLQLLKEYVLNSVTFPVNDGMLNCFSDGLHIYEQYFNYIDYICVTKGKAKDYV